MDLKDYEKAIENYKRAADLNPGIYYVLITGLLLYILNNRYDEARGIYWKKQIAT